MIHASVVSSVVEIFAYFRKRATRNSWRRMQIGDVAPAGSHCDSGVFFCISARERVARGSSRNARVAQDGQMVEQRSAAVILAGAKRAFAPDVF